MWVVGTLAPGASATLTVNVFALTPFGYQVYAQVSRLGQRDVDSSPGNGRPPRVGEDDQAYLDLSVGDERRARPAGVGAVAEDLQVLSGDEAEDDEASVRLGTGGAASGTGATDLSFALAQDVAAPARFSTYRVTATVTKAGPDAAREVEVPLPRLAVGRARRGARAAGAGARVGGFRESGRLALARAACAKANCPGAALLAGGAAPVCLARHASPSSP